jgi:hypothetical protein
MTDTHCQRCDSAIEKGDLRCAVCGHTVEWDAASLKTAVLDVLRCEGCGAAMAYDIKAQAPLCGFCACTMHMETIEDPVEQTESYLPLLVDRAQAAAALKNWLGNRGFLCPGDLLQSAKLETLKPLWWTAWVFDAEAKVSWAADSNAGAGQADWAPHSGQVSMNFSNILVSASRGLSDKEVNALVSGYDLASAQTAAPNEEGALIEQFDVQRSSARTQILDAIHRIAGARVSNEEVPGSHIRNLKLEACLESLKTSRLAFPAYVLAYRYRDKLYRAVVHGQDSETVIGNAPLSWLRVLALVCGVAVALGLLMLIATQVG